MRIARGSFMNIFRKIVKSVLVIFVFVFFCFFSIKAEEEKEKIIVAVLDFENTSNSSEFDYLQNAIPEMLITDLLISKKIKVVEREKLKRVLGELKLSLSGAIPPEQSVEIGKMTGAKALLMGSIIKVGKFMRIDARLIDIKTSEVILGEKVEFSNEDEIIESTDRLAEQIIKNLTGEDIKVSKTPELPKEDVKSFHGKALFMETALNNLYRLQGSKEESYLQIDLFAREVEKKRRLPLNIALVIDRSGSMASEDKLGYVKRAAEFVVNNLNVGDTLSIVTYESEVQVPFEAGKVQDKKYILDIIGKIVPGGSTNLSSGMLEGYSQLGRNHRIGQVNRLLLLSDGLANRGITSGKELQSICQREAQEGLAISTFGVGMQFNEDLMLMLAEYGSGNYYYIDEPENIPNMFDKELKGLLTVVAQNVTLQLESSQKVKIEKVYGYLFEKKRNRMEINLNDIFSREKKTILLKLEVPSYYQDKLRVARVILTYNDVMKGMGKEREVSDLFLQYTKDKKVFKQSENNYVGQTASLMESSLIMKEAVKMVDEGKKKEAQAFLEDNVVFFKEKVERHNTKELKKQLLNLYNYQNTLTAPGLSLKKEEALQKKEKYRQYKIQKGK